MAVLIPSSMLFVVYARIFSGDGLTLLDGKRKSTRGHQRPLEYWRNEHKVFGRDHKSESLRIKMHMSYPMPPSLFDD